MHPYHLEGSLNFELFQIYFKVNFKVTSNKLQINFKLSSRKIILNGQAQATLIFWLPIRNTAPVGTAQVNKYSVKSTRPGAANTGAL
jgi:hypothetical protein